jgi:N-acyl-D-amino-acid deacylase
MMRLGIRLLIAGFFAIIASVVGAEGPNSEQLDGAIARATLILDKGVANYPEHRSCFSCHHQALPLMANSIGNVQSSSGRDKFYERQLTRDVLEFTERSLSGKKSTLSAGGDIGGKALTVAYGLWTMDLAGAPANDTTLAMVENLLKTQAEDGAWDFKSLRPPAASSRAMTSAVAVYGLRSYAHGAVEEQRIQAAYERVMDWSSKHLKSESHEDLIGQLWLEHMLSSELKRPETKRVAQLAKELWSSQRDDGGWAQMPDLPSDPYATGQALILLAEAGNDRDENAAGISANYARGIRFLIDSQQPDGSWLVRTRSKPVQVFFDNGDPHGEHQFISMMATSWATAALREFKHRTKNPLGSPRVSSRLASRS